MAWHYNPSIVTATPNARLPKFCSCETSSVATPIDNTYMYTALSLAAQGKLTCAPNPQVGCVIVHHGKIVGQGYHHQAGTPHAEIHALREAAEKAKGADVYVTLEPCSHTGRTPPCVDALIAAKVARVIIPFTDPNPLVAGQGIAQLRAAGITVITGIAVDAAAWQNRLFLTSKLTTKPYVIAKWAMTTKGELVHPTQRWISNTKARQHAHRWRQRTDAILVGKQTVVDDNPALTNRTDALAPEHIRHPLRLILSQSSTIPDKNSDGTHILQLSRPGLPGQTWWLNPASIAEPIASAYLPGITQWQLPSNDNSIDLPYLLRFLVEHNIASLLVEGGPKTLTTFFEAGLIDEAHVYIDKSGVNDLPCPDHHFWQALASFNKITQVTLEDNTWLQYAKPSDLAMRLTTKTVL